MQSADEGTQKNDRTGTGITATVMRFNLQEGFPLRDDETPLTYV